MALLDDKRSALPDGCRAEAERRHIGALGFVLGFGPIVPLIVAAIVVPLAPPPWSPLAATLARLWGAAILAFVAGVRRGTSFYTIGGPAPSEIAAALGFFAIALLALMLSTTPALGVLAVGYALIAIVDYAAAKDGQVPRYFATLRPIQMSLAAIALAVLSAGG